MRDNKNEEPRPQDRSVLDRPMTIVLVMDTIGNKGNGTSNSALQYAHELERQGHHVRLVGIGAPEYPARVNKVPLVSWVAAKQQMQFAKPSDTLFRTAFAGADVVHLYLPFKFGRCAYKVSAEHGYSRDRGIPPSSRRMSCIPAGPLKYLPGMSGFLYALFRFWLYRRIGHIPRAHRNDRRTVARARVQGEAARDIKRLRAAVHPPKRQRSDGAPASVPFRIVASGRLSHEKDQITLIKAISRCRHAKDIELIICGTGPLQHYLRFRADRLLERKAQIGFHKNAEMPALLRSCDLFVHPSIVDIESLSVIEGMASGAGARDRIRRVERGEPVRVVGRVPVPGSRRGDARPAHRLVDRSSARAGRLGRTVCRTREGRLFGRGVGREVRRHGARGHRRREGLGPASASRLFTATR